jgi:hypothetical protein
MGLVPPSPALSARSQRSNLSVSVCAEKSPTFTFEPWSGYGNTDPPPFSLGGPSEQDDAPACASKPFFGGGTPTWILSGWTFSLTATGVKQDELKKLIERHGGAVARVLHKRVHLVVATEQAVRRNTQKVRKSRAKAIALVTPAFIHDSIKAGEVLENDMASYEPKPPPRQRGAAARAAAALLAAAAVPAATAAVPAATAAVPADDFNWRRAIRRRLREANDGALRRKRLRTDVLAQHLAHVGSSAEDAAGWWRLHPIEHKALFKRRLVRARKAGKLRTQGRMVHVV